MSPEQIRQIAYTYDRALCPLSGIKESGTRLEHTRWMCRQIADDFVANDKIEKANRWLGFIQGVLWIEGIFTIAQLREHSREYMNIDNVAEQ